jgi:hypothetical protein
LTSGHHRARLPPLSSSYTSMPPVAIRESPQSHYPCYPGLLRPLRLSQATCRSRGLSPATFNLFSVTFCYYRRLPHDYSISLSPSLSTTSPRPGGGCGYLSRPEVVCAKKLMLFQRPADSFAYFTQPTCTRSPASPTDCGLSPLQREVESRMLNRSRTCASRQATLFLRLVDRYETCDRSQIRICARMGLGWAR